MLHLIFVVTTLVVCTSLPSTKRMGCDPFVVHNNQKVPTNVLPPNWCDYTDEMKTDFVNVYRRVLRSLFEFSDRTEDPTAQKELIDTVRTSNTEICQNPSTQAAPIRINRPEDKRTMTKYYKKFKIFLASKNGKAIFKDLFNQCKINDEEAGIQHCEELSDFLYGVLYGIEFPENYPQLRADGEDPSFIVSFKDILDYFNTKNNRQFLMKGDPRGIFFNKNILELVKDAINKLKVGFNVRKDRIRTSTRSQNTVPLRFLKGIDNGMSSLANKLSRKDVNFGEIVKMLEENNRTSIDSSKYFGYASSRFVKMKEISKKEIFIRTWTRISLIYEFLRIMKHTFEVRNSSFTSYEIVCKLAYSFLSYKKVDDFIDRINAVTRN